MNCEFSSHISEEDNIVPKNDLQIVMASENDRTYAEQVAQWTQNAGTMLPKTTEEMLDIFKHEHAVLILDDKKNLVSHAAATFVYSDGSIEVGAMYTAAEHRGKGLSTTAVVALLNHLKEKYPGQMLFALANTMSAKVFDKLGGTILQPDQLSSDVWLGCANCPKNPNVEKSGVLFQCCDTPYDLTAVN